MSSGAVCISVVVALFETFRVNFDNFTCEVDETSVTDVSLFVITRTVNTLIFSVLTWVIITVCNIVIIITLFRRRSRAPVGESQLRHYEAYTRITGMLVSLSFGYTIFSLPDSIFELVTTVGLIFNAVKIENLSYIKELHFWSKLCLLLKSAVDCCIYVVIGKQFREVLVSNMKGFYGIVLMKPIDHVAVALRSCRSKSTETDQ